MKSSLKKPPNSKAIQKMTLLRSGVKLVLMKKSSNNLVASIKKGISGTFTFSGKSNQFEFITYFIFSLIVYYGSTILLFSGLDTYLQSISGPLFGIWSIFCFILGISQFANAARRLEDMGVNKWSLLVVLIPIINLFFTLYLCITPSVVKKRKGKRKK